MKNWVLAFSFLLFACHGVGKTGDGVNYATNSKLPCPAPIIMPQEVAIGFGRYASDPMMMNFYKHYLNQQRQLTAYQQRSPEAPNCATAFWVEDGVANNFRQFPQGHPMREFFKTYVAQQRALDAYYSPATMGAR